MNTNTKTAHQRRASIIDDLVLSMERAQDNHAAIFSCDIAGLEIEPPPVSMLPAPRQIGVWRPGCK